MMYFIVSEMDASFDRPIFHKGMSAKFLFIQYCKLHELTNYTKNVYFDVVSTVIIC